MLVVATKNVNIYNNNNNNNNNKVVLLFENLTECSEIHRTLSLVMSRTNPCQICMYGIFTVLGALFSVKKDANRKNLYLSYLLRVNLNSGKSIFSAPLIIGEASCLSAVCHQQPSHYDWVS